MLGVFIYIVKAKRTLQALLPVLSRTCDTDRRRVAALRVVRRLPGTSMRASCLGLRPARSYSTATGNLSRLNDVVHTVDR
mgnify:CR=1 FL=1